MNRSIDRRSDLYALGVSLYEMLTGTLPFTASDPMEWVHCHIAREPISPSKRLNSIPAAVSAIVMKLLAKTAEERYQTAAGVEADLRKCLELLEGSRPRDPSLLRAGTRALPAPAEGIADEDSLPDVASAPQASTPIDQRGRDDQDGLPRRSLRGREHEVASEISEFPLGEYDVPDRLLIPEKLYGRAREIDTLLGSFDRVLATGRPELVLVSGYSGIGKSSIVNELHKVLVPPRGLFASGKFDQ
jgi:serine/threonine protein kinase